LPSIFNLHVQDQTNINQTPNRRERRYVHRYHYCRRRQSGRLRQHAGRVTISNLVDAWNNGQLPANGAYAVLVSPSQACAVSVSNKSTSGFTVTLTPISGAIAAGTIDVLVHQ
jgi:hypothetical protein